MASALLTCVALPLVLCVLTCQGGGKLEFLMTRYSGNCTDNFGMNECDTYFHLCIDKPGAWDMDCAYRKYGPSSHYEDTNNIVFGSDVGGIANPMILNLTRLDSMVMFVVSAYDYDLWVEDDHLVTVGETVTVRSARLKDDSIWTEVHMKRGNYQVSFKYRAYCDANYYTRRCDVYCKPPRDQERLHFACDVTTGQRRCLQGWKGAKCDVDIDECALLNPPCQNNAECVNHPGFYDCHCDGAWMGDNCDFDIDECSLLEPPCQNNATCDNHPGSYVCHCDSGFKGRDCDVIVTACDSAPCQNNGTCLADLDTYSCSCADGWEGKNCEEVDMCLTSPCLNNATCLSGPGSHYTCSCAPGWKGENCSTEVDMCLTSPCLNNATCLSGPGSHYTCACAPGWKGENCSTKVDMCLTSPCLNNATCLTGPGSHFTCACAPGWKGENCSTKEDACMTSPCLNSATCLPGPGSNYTCACAPGWKGENCSTKVNPCERNPCYNGKCVALNWNSYLCTCVDTSDTDDCNSYSRLAAFLKHILLVI